MIIMIIIVVYTLYIGDILEMQNGNKDKIVAFKTHYDHPNKAAYIRTLTNYIHDHQH